jgi:hypothetical protein
MTPTQRSLALLRKQGWTCGIVERFNPHVGPHGIRQDFCGGIDVIAFKAASITYPSTRVVVVDGREWPSPVAAIEGGILGVQCCAASGLAAHRTKLLAEPRMREWVAAGGWLVIHAWRKTNDRQRGKRKTWKLLEEELTLEQFPVPSSAAASA